MPVSAELCVRVYLYLTTSKAKGVHINILMTPYAIYFIRYFFLGMLSLRTELMQQC